MAFNTRRGGAAAAAAANNQFSAQSAPNITQRRPPQQQMAKNFVSGGQLSGPNKPPMQQQQQQQGQQQQVAQRQQAQQPKPASQQQQHMLLWSQIQNMFQQQKNMRQQALQFLNRQQAQPPQQQQQQQQQLPHVQPIQQQIIPAMVQPPPVQQQQQPPVQQQQQPPVQQQQQPPMSLPKEDSKLFKTEDAPVFMATSTPVQGTTEVEGGDAEPKKHKPFWMKRDGVAKGKVTKKERLRRRNQRLRKILQPKNALMVLNELIGSTPYNVTETADMYEGTLFKCSIQVDGLEHVGMGKSKPAAKTASAEAALKHMVLSKLKDGETTESAAASSTSISLGCLESATAIGMSEMEAAISKAEKGIKMDVEGDDNLCDIPGISWSHVACYALHKLLSSWDEGSNFAERLAQAAASAGNTSGGAPLVDKAKSLDKKPAKKLPEAAASMNPIMLLNQMHPEALYEEVARFGNPPLVQFSVRCTVGGESFVGSGSTKKSARKICAFAACRKLLGIKYGNKFMEENGFFGNLVSAIPQEDTPMQTV